MNEESSVQLKNLLAKPGSWLIILVLAALGTSGWVVRLAYGESWALFSWAMTLVMYIGLTWMVLCFVKSSKQE